MPASSESAALHRLGGEIEPSPRGDRGWRINAFGDAVKLKPEVAGHTGQPFESTRPNYSPPPGGMSRHPILTLVPVLTS